MKAQGKDVEREFLYFGLKGHKHKSPGQSDGLESPKRRPGYR